MAIAVEVLVQAAREYSAQALPFPELGIDWWDIAEHCPFHGFRPYGEGCGCGFFEDKPLDTEYYDNRFDLESFHFDRVADREEVVRKENRW